MKQLVYKVLISTFICLTCIGTCERTIINASETFTVNDVIYHVLDRDSVEVEEYVGTAENVDIPERINNYNVTSIGYGAFAGSHTMKKLSIPKSIRKIEKLAFHNSTLEQIELPKYIEEVGYYAFEGTPLYRNAGTIKYVGNICLGVDGKCNLQEINILEGTRVIADGAFQHNEYITTVQIPNSMMFVGEDAFAWCKNLTTINIPDDVNIGRGAFYNDKKLTNITGDTEYLENNGAFSNTPVEAGKYAKEIGKTTVILFVTLICFMEVIVFGKRLLREGGNQ